MKYNKEYFISKFERMRDKDIVVGRTWGQVGRDIIDCFASGDRWNDEWDSFRALFEEKAKDYWYIIDISDGKNPDYQQPFPRQRILAALRDLK